MKKLYLPLITLLLLASCATTIKFKVEHPPLVDLRDVFIITVIPLEWNKTGIYTNLADDVTRSLTNGIKRSRKFTFFNPAVLRDLDEREYCEYVDVYITGKIMKVDTDNKHETREEKDGDKTTEKTYTTRTVTVDIEYKYIRAINNEVLGVFNKTEKHSSTFKEPEGVELLVNFLFEIFTQGEYSTDSIARSAIGNFSYTMTAELFPWTGTEEKRIQKSTSKDKRFKEAQKLVRQKQYSSALLMYKNIFEETGSVVAGYNTALLLQANGQFIDALELLENLNENLLKKDINSPRFLRDEIEKLKKLINEFELLEEYKSP